MTLVLCLTDYKVQGQMYNYVIVDLQTNIRSSCTMSKSPSCNFGPLVALLSSGTSSTKT